MLTSSFSRLGHSSLFPMEDERSFGEDESGDQVLAGLGPAHCFPPLNGERVERYSRKVFVGGLPPDIDEGESRYDTNISFTIIINNFNTHTHTQFFLIAIFLHIC